MELYKDTWDEHYWQHDKMILEQALQDQKKIGSEILFKSLKNRKNDARAVDLIARLTQQSLEVATYGETNINTLTERDCAQLWILLTNLKDMAALELQGTKNSTYFIELFKQRQKVLQGWEASKTNIDRCIISGELTDEGRNALKEHASNQLLSTLANELTVFLKNKMSNSITIETIDNTDKWLQSVKNAGIVLTGTDTVDSYLKILQQRKDALNKPDNPNPPKGTNLDEKSDKNASSNQQGSALVNVRSILLVCGAFIVSYIIFHQLNKQPQITKKREQLVK